MLLPEARYLVAFSNCYFHFTDTMMPLRILENCDVAIQIKPNMELTLIKVRTDTALLKLLNAETSNETKDLYDGKPPREDKRDWRAFKIECINSQPIPAPLI